MKLLSSHHQQNHPITMMLWNHSSCREPSKPGKRTLGPGWFAKCSSRNVCRGRWAQSCLEVILGSASSQLVCPLCFLAF